jgi:hypothetical protein
MKPVASRVGAVLGQEALRLDRRDVAGRDARARAPEQLMPPAADREVLEIEVDRVAEFPERGLGAVGAVVVDVHSSRRIVPADDG